MILNQEGFAVSQLNFCWPGVAQHAWHGSRSNLTLLHAALRGRLTKQSLHQRPWKLCGTLCSELRSVPDVSQFKLALNAPMRPFVCPLFSIDRLAP